MEGAKVSRLKGGKLTGCKMQMEVVKGRVESKLTCLGGGGTIVGQETSESDSGAGAAKKTFVLRAGYRAIHLLI